MHTTVYLTYKTLKIVNLSTEVWTIYVGKTYGHKKKKKKPRYDKFKRPERFSVSYDLNVFTFYALKRNESLQI